MNKKIEKALELIGFKKKSDITLFFGNPTPPVISKEDIQLMLNEYLTKARELINDQKSIAQLPMDSDSAQRSKQLYDFFSLLRNGVGFTRNLAFNDGSGVFPSDIGDGIENTPKDSEPEIKKTIPEKPKKPDVKPKDVLHELSTIPVPFTLENLDHKIEMLKRKSKLVKDFQVGLEIDGVIEKLEARKKYNKHEEFFKRFPCTTTENIEVLVEKYNLVIKETDFFIPHFPDDATTVMEAYTDVVKEITGKVPVYYVIAEKKDFQSKEEKYKKPDPILLVQSPSGYFWQVLGAWDETLILLSEL
jgi:hypothetical protein